MSVRIITADVLEGLASLPDESVHCVVTSPPYWGLRDYGTATWEGGEPNCDHRSPTMREGRNEDRAALSGSVATNREQLLLAHRTACGKCGAVKVDRQLGLEPTLGEHIDAMAAVFREVRRVLRKDGTLWLNYGDCYATSVNGRSAADTKAAGNDDRTFRDKPFSTVGPIHAKRVTAGQAREDVDVGGWGARDDGLRWRGGGTLKPKDLCGVPWRLALALQDDGWWLRQDIIWSKPNPMPESIKDRCTKAHEYLFLLTKAERYHFDAEAIAEEATADHPPGNNSHKGATAYANGATEHRTKAGLVAYSQKQCVARAKDADESSRNPNSRPHSLSEFEAKNGRNYPTRNKRSVWTVPTQPFPEAHFATFPPELIEPCIKAGCPLGGTVLDPFGGSGTTGLVADRLGRNAILIELNPEYAAMAARRINGDAGMFAKVETSTPAPFIPIGDAASSVVDTLRAKMEKPDAA